MNIYLPKYSAITAERGILIKFNLYKDVLFDENNAKTSILPFSSTEIIIDKIKELFGLNHFNRRGTVLPSQELKMLESHYGIERSLDSEEIGCYEVYKIRLFRWLVGLPNSHPSVDIIARIYEGHKTYVSYRDIDIKHDRRMDISFPLEYDIKLMFSEMVEGIESLADLKDIILDIIKSVNKDHVYLATSITIKIDEYGLFPN